MRTIKILMQSGSVRTAHPTPPTSVAAVGWDKALPFPAFATDCLQRALCRPTCEKPVGTISVA